MCLSIVYITFLFFSRDKPFRPDDPVKQVKDSALDSFKYLIRSSYFPFFIRMLFVDFKFVIPDDTINYFEAAGLKTQKMFKTLFRPAFIKSTLSYVIFSNRRFYSSSGSPAAADILCIKCAIMFLTKAVPLPDFSASSMFSESNIKEDNRIP